MFPTLKNLHTGEERICVDWDMSVYWWTEGNGGCDCNRSLAMGITTVQDWDGECLGSEQFIAIDVHGDLEGCPAQEVLTAMNEGYVNG